MSDCLLLCELQHAKFFWSPLFPGVCSNSCSLSQWCCLTISSSVAPFSCLQSFPASGYLFSNELAFHIRWPKYWNFSFSISPSKEYWRLISFRIDRFDLLAVQGTLKSLLQHYSSKASILWCSAFFIMYSQNYIKEKVYLWYALRVNSRIKGLGLRVSLSIDKIIILIKYANTLF